MENMKFRIDSPEQSEALQNVLFSLGYRWNLFDNKKPVHEFLDMPFLWASDDNSITYANGPKDDVFFERHTNKEQNTAEFIATHTKKDNMNKATPATELTFDINADISRQYTRDGRKVIHIHDTGFDIIYPISAVIEGEASPRSYTGNGTFYNGATIDQLDIVTRPEIKPLIVDYLNVYRDLLGFCGDHNNYTDAVEATAGSEDFIATIRLTYNPNDGSVSAEIVKQ